MSDTPNPSESGVAVARSVAQFFFEVGYGACFADAMIHNDLKPPFELTDAHIEAAFPRSIEAHEDGAEMDRYLALAHAEPRGPEVSREAVARADDDDPCPDGEHCCCCGPGDVCCDCGARLIDLERDIALSRWTDFLDDNPDDLTSPEDLPDHALVTFEQFFEMARDVLPRLALTPSTKIGEGEHVFITSQAAVVGCTAQAVAAASVMALANSTYAEDDATGQHLFDNSETIAGVVLRGLGIDPRARGALPPLGQDIGSQAGEVERG